jgi:RNA polymerase sigma factor (sigma-70 family)
VARHKRRYQTFSFSLDPGLSVQLRRDASLSNQSLDKFIRELLATGLEHRKLEIQVTHALANLTAREREIALLVARGCTNKQIAETLVISEETVKTHIRNILQKLGLDKKLDLHVYLTKLSGS